MASHSPRATSPSPVPDARHRPHGTGDHHESTAIVVLLDPAGHADVVDLTRHPEGPRLIKEITAGLDRSTSPDDGPSSAPVDPDNVVRLPVLPLPRQLRVLPAPEVAGPYGRPILVEDRPDHGAVRWIEFSPREFEVLQLVVAGYSNQQIADQLFLGINTIKSYIRTGYRKIHVERRSQAVRWGFLHGLGRGDESDG